MSLSSVWRSTPFRLAVTFACIFVAAFLLAGVITYQLFKKELLDNLDRSMRELHTVIASSYDTNDLEDLTATVGTYARLNKPRERVFALFDSAGTMIAGNALPNSVPDGLSTARARTLGFNFSGDYRVIAGPAGEYRLIIAESFNETDRLEDIAFRSFIWATLLVALLAVAGGVYVAAKAQRRLDGIASAMTSVSHGRLDTRVPIHGSYDDIDVVSLQINEALERLSTLVETMRQVSSDMAHELKTPLNRLKMHIEDAVEESENGQDVAQSLQNARDEVDQINATFEALLRISQIEAGARKTRFQTLDLTQILADVSEIYAGVAEDAGMTLADRIDRGNSSSIDGDRELLTQMFVNLVENAIRHCPKGTVITLAIEKQGPQAVASIADDGPGIPEDERHKVFRRLYRLDKSRTTAGSGLGLSLVHAIVDLHDGQVELADNRPGLKVEVTLPLS
ncbi:HAMP domain-containing histidine kinase [Rhizobium sp. KVB221]|uniref:histidine kinase n=1 Tax=Rhizobium setariae TaxID=2801340 RepID=A0A937CR61_9HYPH|nr:HAMP domain-containing sensor histidine kinase [Rhizobium setariae]MBL0373972.1 HAMP domain-containing histidine kinase [Rhizobium setariae]